MIKRGGLPLRISCLALILFLCGGASLTTTGDKRTESIHNATLIEKSAAIRVEEQMKPTATNPNLEVKVIRQVTQEETYQRRFVEKRVLKSGARAT